MGLDVSHGCWNGCYSTFTDWRREIAKAADMPPLDLMEGYCKEGRPIKWLALVPSPLHFILNHSDCDGIIQWPVCKSVADSLKKIIPNVSKGGIINWQQRTYQFMQGLYDAYNHKEDVEFC